MSRHCDIIKIWMFLALYYLPNVSDDVMNLIFCEMHDTDFYGNIDIHNDVFYQTIITISTVYIGRQN